MSELTSSPYFGVALSVIAFAIGVKLQQKLKTPVCNPLIIAISPIRIFWWKTLIPPTKAPNPT